MKNIYKILKYLLGFIIIITLVVLAEYFVNSTHYDVIVDEVEYFDDPKIDYRVHYQDNPYYNQGYIESGKSYVTLLTDYIDIDFDYHLFYSKSINASSVYDIKATLVATDSKTHNIVWDNYKKEYVTRKNISANGNKDYSIKESVRINFPEFNNFLTEYRNSNHVNVDGEILVELYVKNMGTYEHLDNINSNNRIEVHIPLNKENYIIETVTEPKSDRFTYKESNQGAKVRGLIIGGSLWVIVIALTAYLALNYRKDVMKESDYSRKLRKILNSYDGIIVNVDKLPSLDKINVAEVTEFEELVDAQNEVRLPINFKEDKKRGIAKFVLIRNNLAWVYILREGDKREK